MKRIIALSIALILTMSVVLGCATTTTTATTKATTAAAVTTGAAVTTAAATTTAAAVTTAATTTLAPKRLKMYYITKVIGSTYWSVVEAGVKKAAAESNVDVVYTGLQSETDVEKQVQLLQDAVSAKPDAILIAPCDSTAMAGPVTTAFKAGIPIVLIDTIINAESYNAILATDNTQAGAVCAEQMIKQLKAANVTKAVVGVIAASSGSQTVQQRLTGFTDYWTKNAPADWKVLMNEIKYNDASVDKAIAATQDILTAHPECNAIWTVNNSCTVGAGTVLKEQNKKNFTLVGMDFSPDTEDLLKLGFVKTAIIQQQYVMGYQGVKIAIDIINKKTVTRKTDTGVFWVDMSNINTPEAELKMYPAGRPVKK
jgi:ribose transport system substrate-binding protein